MTTRPRFPWWASTNRDPHGTTAGRWLFHKPLGYIVVRLRKPTEADLARRLAHPVGRGNETDASRTVTP